MFVDFVGHPYPRIFVSLNLYFKSKFINIGFYHLKQSLGNRYCDIYTHITVIGF